MGGLDCSKSYVCLLYTRTRTRGTPVDATAMTCLWSCTQLHALVMGL